MILRCNDERKASETEWNLIAIVAQGPEPVRPHIERTKLQATIGYLATVLRTQAHSLDHGKIRLSAYQRVLRDQPIEAIDFAANWFLRNSNWMPEPAQFLAKALEWRDPDKLAYKRACTLFEHRQERLATEIYRRIVKRELPEEELEQIPDLWRLGLTTRRVILTDHEGRLRYWTKELEAGTLQAKKAETEAILEEAGLNDERIFARGEGEE